MKKVSRPLPVRVYEIIAEISLLLRIGRSLREKDFVDGT